MFDPMYDAYGSMARRAGGIVKAVKLNEQDWTVDRGQLKKAFSDRTKLVVVNTPHNPTGKVFSKEDLQYIADLAIQYDAYVLLDEVRSPAALGHRVSPFCHACLVCCLCFTYALLHPVWVPVHA